MKPGRFSTYNDGMLFVCRNNTERSDFAAVKNAKAKNDLSIEQKLAFDEMSKRDEDMMFAESIGRKLSMKVKTRLVPSVSNQNQVIIEKTLYSIYKIDFDRKKKEMYIYLEEERQIS